MPQLAPKPDQEQVDVLGRRRKYKETAAQVGTLAGRR